jgi:hypothetical protein
MILALCGLCLAAGYVDQDLDRLRNLSDSVVRQVRELSVSKGGEQLTETVTALEEAIKGCHIPEVIVDFEGSAVKNLDDSVFDGLEGGNFTLFVPVKPGNVSLPLRIYPHGSLSDWRITNVLGHQIQPSEQDCSGPLPLSCACNKIWLSEVGGQWKLHIVPGPRSKAICFWNLRLEERPEEL